MYNRVILMGRLTADPELRQTPSGVSMCRITIAVDRSFVKQGEERKADFFDITFWRQQAEFVCRYFSKGRAIGVEGSIQTRDYTDKDGNRRYAFEVVADRVFFVESKGASTGSGADFPATSNGNVGVSYSSGSEGDFQVLDDDNDLPF